MRLWPEERCRWNTYRHNSSRQTALRNCCHALAWELRTVYWDWLRWRVHRHCSLDGWQWPSFELTVSER
eukprot:1357486-Amphidinium_carterae.1